MKNKRFLRIFAKITVAASLFFLFAASMAHGESLQQEFDTLCVHTQEAESFSLEKLQDLLNECDQLQKKIEASNDEKKKVLLFRLNKCRDFLTYVIEIKQSGN